MINNDYVPKFKVGDIVTHVNRTIDKKFRIVKVYAEYKKYYYYIRSNTDNDIGFASDDRFLTKVRRLNLEKLIERYKK